MKSSPAARAGRQSSSSSSGGRSTMISPSTPAALASARKRAVAVGVDRVVVAHQHDRRRAVGRAEAPHQLQRPGHAWRRPRAPAGSPPGSPGRRPSGSVNGMPISIRSAPAAGRPAISSQRGREVGVARGQEGDQPRPALGLELREARVDPAAHSSTPMALRDREHVLVAAAAQIHDDDLVRCQRRRQLDHLADGVAGLERRQDALEPAAEREGVQRLVVGDRLDLDPADVLEPGLLRPDARIVEPGRDRVRLDHLAVLVLQQVGALAVQDAGPARGHRRGVLAGVDAVARGLDRRRSGPRGRRGRDGTGPWRWSRRRRRPPARRAAGPPSPASAPWPRCRSSTGSRAPWPDRGAAPPPCR